MADNKKDSAVYRRLKPYTFSFIAKLILYLLALLVIDGMCIAFAILTFVTERDYAAVVFGISLMAVVTFCMIRSMKKNLGCQKSLAEQRIRMRNSLSYNQFAELDEEVGSGERFWGTIYFLDKFVYVPQTGLLIAYENIKSVTVVTHTTDGLTDGAKVIITDENGVGHFFWIAVGGFKKFLSDEDQELFRRKISKRLMPDFKTAVEKSSV